MRACFAFAFLLLEGGGSSGHIISLLVTPTFPHACTGWQTPEIALIDAHKLLRSIVLLLMGSDVLSAQKTAVETPFLDYGKCEEES